MVIRGSFEDIIYIVIGVIWIAYSIYKGTQKSKAGADKRKRNSEPQEKKKSVFETFFDEILVEKNPIPYEPVIDEIEIEEGADGTEIVQEKIFSYDDYYEQDNLQKADSINEKSAASQSQRKQDLKATPSKKRKKPRIDLRKAVVYSEILNRRYF